MRDTQVTFIITEFSDREIRLAYFSSTNYILVTHTATENINSKSAENDRFIKFLLTISSTHQDLLDIKESKTWGGLVTEFHVKLSSLMSSKPH